MKKYRFIPLWFFCVLFCLISSEIPVQAHPLVQGELHYEAKKLSVEGTALTITGTFANDFQNQDIYDVREGVINLYDGDHKLIETMNFNSESQSEIFLSPGASWSYTITRDTKTFDAKKYNMSGCSVEIDFSYSSDTHTGTGCSRCKAHKDNLQYSTEDTVTDEEYYEILDKLRVELGGLEDKNTVSASSYESENNDYYSAGKLTSDQESCPTCKGRKKVFCTHCDGQGYKTRTEKRFCGLAHHAGCENRKKGCNGKCHEGDYRTVKDYCSWCDKSGQMPCKSCHGSGKR